MFHENSLTLPEERGLPRWGTPLCGLPVRGVVGFTRKAGWPDSKRCGPRVAGKVSVFTRRAADILGKGYRPHNRAVYAHQAGCKAAFTKVKNVKSCGKALEISDHGSVCLKAYRPWVASLGGSTPGSSVAKSMLSYQTLSVVDGWLGSAPCS